MPAHYSFGFLSLSVKSRGRRRRLSIAANVELCERGTGVRRRPCNVYMRCLIVAINLTQILCALLPSIRVAGLSQSEQALVGSIAEEAAGSSFELTTAPSNNRRVVIFDDLDVDNDAWLLEDLAEQLDEAQLPPVLVTASAASCSVDEAVEEHVQRYGLRRPLEVSTSSWQATDATLALHATLDGAIVEHATSGPDQQQQQQLEQQQEQQQNSWWDVSSVAVYDGVVDEELRASLLALLSSAGWDPEAGADPSLWERGTFNDAQSVASVNGVAMRASGWGLMPEALERLCAEEPDSCAPAILELQSRLVALLRTANPAAPFDLCRQSDAVFGGSITPLAANAPIAADGDEAYGWHIDADPALLPPSPWTDCYGRHPNRLPGAPRFITALIYLSPRWEAEWGAPTRFFDPPTGEVLEVQPSPGRVLLMDQDITHAVTSPKPEAGDRPRYSLVLKLVMHPREPPSGVSSADATAPSTSASSDASDASDASGGGDAPTGGEPLRLADPAWGDGIMCVGSACTPPDESGGGGRTRQPSEEFRASREAEAAHVAAVKRAAEVYYGAVGEVEDEASQE